VWEADSTQRALAFQHRSVALTHTHTHYTHTLHTHHHQLVDFEFELCGKTSVSKEDVIRLHSETRSKEKLNSREGQVSTLLALGFPEAVIHQALDKTGGDVDAAAGLLFEGAIE
jgi:hypothetical protein